MRHARFSRRIVLVGFSCCLCGVTQAWAQEAPVGLSTTTPASAVPAPDGPRLFDPAPARPLSFRRLFVEAGRDLARLPSRENLILFGLGGSAAIIGHAWDDSVTGSLSGATVLEEPLEAGEVVGGAFVQFGAAMATYAIGRLADKPKVAELGGDLVRAGIVAQTVTQTVKLVVGRTRPDGTRYSFPSGHTSTSFATATVLQRHFGWKAGVPAYALATYVAANRIQSERHYLSDVIFGATVGLIAGRTVTIGRGDHRFVVTPMATPGGAGIAFVHVGR